MDRKQTSISRFVVALEKEEEKYKQRPPELDIKPSTPVRTKVQRFEDGSKSPGLFRSSGKIFKLRNKQGSKVQSTIKMFLNTEPEVTNPIQGINIGKHKKPTWLGACGKPSLAKTSRPRKDSLTLEGGKHVKGKKREGIGQWPLARWLLAGSVRAKESGVGTSSLPGKG